MAWSRVSATTRSTRARSSARLPGQLCAASSASAAWVNVRGGSPSAAGAIFQQPRRQHRVRLPAGRAAAANRSATPPAGGTGPREIDAHGRHRRSRATRSRRSGPPWAPPRHRRALRHRAQYASAAPGWPRATPSHPAGTTCLRALPRCGCRSTPIPDRSARGSAPFRTGRGRSERHYRRRSRWRSTARPQAGCARAARAQSTGRRSRARRPATRRCRATRSGASAPARGRWRPTLPAAQLEPMSRARVERVGHWPV